MELFIAGKTPPKAVKVSFSLQKQFTPLSVDDIRNVLGDAASDPETQKPEHVCDWQDLAEQYVATEVPSDDHSRSNSHRAPRKNSKAAEKRWKGKTKRKGGRAKKLGFEALREEFPGAWFRGKAHRGASKANGFEWAGEGSREGYSSDDEYSLSDGEVLVLVELFWSFFLQKVAPIQTLPQLLGTFSHTYSIACSMLLLQVQI